MRPFMWGFFRGFRAVSVWGWTAGQAVEVVARVITHIFIKDTKRRELTLDNQRRVFVLDAKRHELTLDNQRRVFVFDAERREFRA